MDKYLVSMMRFSTAVTLFGLEQDQSAIGSVGSGEDRKASLEKIRKSMDDFSDSVMAHVDTSKKETLETVTRVSEDTVRQAMSGVGAAMNPRQMMQMTGDMVKRTSDSVVHWIGAGETHSDDEPKSASAALGGSGKGRAKAS